MRILLFLAAECVALLLLFFWPGPQLVLSLIALVTGVVTLYLAIKVRNKAYWTLLCGFFSLTLSIGYLLSFLTE